MRSEGTCGERSDKGYACHRSPVAPHYIEGRLGMARVKVRIRVRDRDRDRVRVS